MAKIKKGSSSAEKGRRHLSGFGLKHFLNVTHLLGLLTRGGFAYGWVFGAKLVTLHTQTVEAAVRVDAALSARIGGGALVYVDARLPVVFKAEARMASALREGRAGVFPCVCCQQAPM